MGITDNDVPGALYVEKSPDWTSDPARACSFHKALLAVRAVQMIPVVYLGNAQITS